MRGRLASIALITSLATLASDRSPAEVGVAAGITSESTAAVTLAVDTRLPLTRLHPRLDLRLGTGLLLLSSREHDGNAAWLLTPALRYTFAGEAAWFVEGGIGAALFVDTRLDERELSTAFQFHDRLALGRAFGDGELTLSLNHYSNASIESPNDGFETLMLGYRWAW
ncbi:acyloxyacyl hydrolase [Billgrantia azerbaijanica]|nr:acyloxyacyl hydrolase [Halomonas azerbaijanica]